MKNFGTSDFGLRTSDFGLRSSDFGLQTSVSGLRTSDFGLLPNNNQNSTNLPDDFTVECLSSQQYDEWNEFVERSPQGDVFCYSWWLDAITKSNFKIYAAKEQAEIVAGFVAAYDSNNKINEPALTRTLGILYKPYSEPPDRKRSAEERRWLEVLLEKIPHDDIVQFCTHQTITNWLPFKYKGLKQTTRYTYILDYKGRSVKDLWKGLNRGKKNMIIRAGKNGIRLYETDDFEQVITFTGLTYKRQGLKMKYEPDDLRMLDNAARLHGKRLILSTIDNTGRTHAVIYLAFNNRSAYALVSGGDPALRKMGGHTLVMWEAIKYFHDKVAYFNFGGSDIRKIEDHVRGFGGVITPYFHIYNEKLLHYDEIRFHLKELGFHLKSLINATYLRLRN
jgi:hypothetical protein